MAPRPSPFTKKDVENVLKAAREAGVDVQRLEIDSQGKMTVVFGAPMSPEQEKTALDLWRAGDGAG
jgi:hypothetical protein